MSRFIVDVLAYVAGLCHRCGARVERRGWRVLCSGCLMRFMVEVLERAGWRVVQSQQSTQWSWSTDVTADDERWQ